VSIVNGLLSLMVRADQHVSYGTIQ
jgi:hypothetical protein